MLDSPNAANPSVNLAWHKGDGLLPAIVQDAATGQVLMLGYMNQETYGETLASRRVTFYSRSRQTRWQKGESSGHWLNVVSTSVDCDQDTILIQANPQGPTCHLGTPSCFSAARADSFQFLQKLDQLIADRRGSNNGQSYTAKLFADGLDRIAQKVGEEAVEVVIASKNSNEDEFVGEAADLVYHLMVLCRAREVSFKQVLERLEQRH